MELTIVHIDVSYTCLPMIHLIIKNEKQEIPHCRNSFQIPIAKL